MLLAALFSEPFNDFAEWSRPEVEIALQCQTAGSADLREFPVSVRDCG